MSRRCRAIDVGTAPPSPLGEDPPRDHAESDEQDHQGDDPDPEEHPGPRLTVRQAGGHAVPHGPIPP